MFYPSKKLKFEFLIGLMLFCIQPCFGYFGLDTLFICQGESVQLLTTPNQLNYDWIPTNAISDPTIYNPIVNPEETTTYIVTIEPNQEENLVNNGDFNSGNSGFYSDYIYTPGGTFMQGHYAILTDPTQFNGGFENCSDHSPGPENLMMVVDGATIPNENVWCQTISVYPNREYNFSAYVTNIFNGEPAILQFSINGELLADPFTTPMVCDWEEFFSTWYSGSFTEAEICIVNQNTIAQGNDFALDDIFFTFENTRSIDTFVVIVNEPVLTQFDTIICENLSFEFDGTTIPADTIIEFNYSTWQGCDSTIVWNVGSIDTAYFEIRVDTLCPGDTIMFQGSPITQDIQICEVYTGSFGCDSTYCFVAYFLSESTIDIQAIAPSCPGESDGSLEAVPFAGLPPYQYLWGDGSTNSSIQNLGTSEYSVTVTDAKGCLAVKPYLLEDPPAINFSFEAISPSCNSYADGSVTLNISGGNPDYLIDFDGEGFTPLVNFDSLMAGTYSVIIEDSKNCILDTSLIILQPQELTIILPADTSIQLGGELRINSTIISQLPYAIEWSPALGLDCIDCEDPVTNTFESTNYELLVFDDNGCFTTSSIFVSVEKDYEVFIPNVFSPNADGVNDHFEIFTGRDVAEINYFRIFNRWGAMLFEAQTCDAGQANCRWDGLFKDKDMAPGIYVYLIEIRFIDGVTRIFSGDVLLIK